MRILYIHVFSIYAYVHVERDNIFESNWIEYAEKHYIKNVHIATSDLGIVVLLTCVYVV